MKFINIVLIAIGYLVSVSRCQFPNGAPAQPANGLPTGMQPQGLQNQAAQAQQPWLSPSIAQSSAGLQPGMQSQGQQNQAQPAQQQGNPLPWLQPGQGASSFSNAPGQGASPSFANGLPSIPNGLPSLSNLPSIAQNLPIPQIGQGQQGNPLQQLVDQTRGLNPLPGLQSSFQNGPRMGPTQSQELVNHFVDGMQKFCNYLFDLGIRRPGQFISGISGLLP